MAFSFLKASKKQKTAEQSHEYAVNELQSFLKEITPQKDIYFTKYLKNDLPNDTIVRIYFYARNCNRVTSTAYVDYFFFEKYCETKNLKIEEFFNTCGKEATDELLYDFKAMFDNKIMQSVIADGKWKFPVYELYKICFETGVDSLDNSFSIQKAITVAKNIMNEENISSEYQVLYVNKDNIFSLFDEGKRKYAIVKANEEKDRLSPKKGKLSDSEYSCVELSQKLKSIVGIEKRKIMFQDAICRINKRIEDYNDSKKALNELGIMLDASTCQEKKKDWAVIGGIAEGIAGPVAGLAAAAGTIAENIEIERRNEIKRQAVSNTIKELAYATTDVGVNIIQLENKLAEMDELFDTVGNKVVLEQYTTDEIFKKLEISSTVCKLENGNGLQLTVSIKNNFIADVPENITVSVDGTLNAKIYFKDILLDTVCVYLPLFGIQNHDTVTMYTDCYIESEDEYSAEIEANNLWIVEL